MDSRPILKNAEKIELLVDSKTFDDLLRVENRLSIAILKHYGSDMLHFYRTPLRSEFSELNNIPSYELQSNGNENCTIKIKETTCWCRINDITTAAKRIYGKEHVNDEELNRIVPVFVHAAYNQHRKSNIYITNDQLVLKNRLWLESYSSGCCVNIMSVGEATIFLDLFFKKMGKYLLPGNGKLNKGFWYWLSMRSKIPRYNVGDPLLDALATRFYYALMALDEMGIQYYLGVNNDTIDNTLYHFNYLITLITGIFDNLALKTNIQLGINCTNLIRVSINNSSGHDFLVEIRNRRPDIRLHINAYVDFINLIYSFREMVIHREGLSKTSFESNNAGEEWRAIFIKVNEEIKQKLNSCGDTRSDYDPFTKWGFYELNTQHFIDPYNFSIEALKKLICFVDKYLELLGCPSFVESQIHNDDVFAKTLLHFEKYHLGF